VYPDKDLQINDAAFVRSKGSCQVLHKDLRPFPILHSQPRFRLFFLRNVMAIQKRGVGVWVVAGGYAPPLPAPPPPQFQLRKGWCPGLGFGGVWVVAGGYAPPPTHRPPPAAFPGGTFRKGHAVSRGT
jgi:hypothetical protein